MWVLRVKLKMEQILMNIVPLIVIGSKIRQKLKKKQLLNSPPFIYSK